MGLQLDDSVLIHADGSGFSVMGQALRLDMAGVVCEFVDTGQGSAEVEKMDILVLNQPRRCLLGLPCTLIQDDFSNENRPFSFFSMRRIELRFNTLSDEQQNRLGTLLDWLSGEETDSFLQRPLRKRPRSTHFGGRESGELSVPMRSCSMGGRGFLP